MVAHPDITEFFGYYFRLAVYGQVDRCLFARYTAMSCRSAARLRCYAGAHAASATCK